MKDPGYAYVCEDKSILLPIFKRALWSPLAERIPASISANTLSMAGSLCAVLAFVSSMMIDPTYPTLYLIPGALVFCYLTLDNVDGAHARKTGQSSPLGEFIDHWLDTFNNGFLIWALAVALHIPSWGILALLGAVGLAFFGAIWEQRHTGVIQMEALGNVEGLVMVCLLYLALAIFGVERLSGHRIFGLLTFVECAVLFTFVNAAFTSVRCLVRTKVARLEWAPLTLIVSVSVAWFLLGAPSDLAVASILLFANPAFTGRHVVHRVSGRPASRRARGLFLWALPLAAGLSVILQLDATAQRLLAWLCAGALALQSLYDFSVTVHGLRAHLQPKELLGRVFLRSR